MTSRREATNGAALGDPRRSSKAKPTTSKPDLVGPDEIARRLKVKPGTVAIWGRRGLLPEPEWTISRIPVWTWSVIEQWSKETGHPRKRPH